MSRTSETRAPDASSQLQDQERLAQKMEAVGRLAGGVAHYFNNLLTAVNGYSQLLSQLSPPPPQSDYVEEIRQAGLRATEMTAKLMGVSRRQLLQPEVVQPGLLIAGLQERLEQTLGEGVALETRSAADLARVKVDPALTEQVLLELAANARDAMPEGGRFRVEAANVELDRSRAGVPPGAYVCLTVTDTGTGIEADDLELVFEPFFTTKKKDGKTGFGLATVYATVARSHGYIHVDTTPGAGTTFRIYLPQAEAEPESAS